MYYLLRGSYIHTCCLCLMTVKHGNNCLVQEKTEKVTVIIKEEVFINKSDTYFTAKVFFFK